MLYWNPWVISGLIGGSLVLSIALVVLFSAPGRSQNRALALVLFAESTGILAGTWFMYSVMDARISFAAQAYTVLAMFMSFPAYLLFLSTLETPLVRPLRTKAARVLMVGFVPIPFILLALYTDLFVQAPTIITPFAPRSPVSQSGPWFKQGMLLLVFTYVYGLVVAISAFRRAPPGSTTKDRSRMFVWAFGLRDGLFLVNIVAANVLLAPALSPPAWLLWFIGNTSVNIIEIVYAPILAYGILRHQLFDIDLKIKAAFRGSAIAAVFAAGFFVAAEAAEGFVGIEGFWPGLAVAALITLALRPLHGWATRLADAAMPRVQDTEEYRLVRKHEVYAAAVESALVDGRMSEQERRVLATLAGHLGLSADETVALETQVTTAVPA